MLKQRINARHLMALASFLGILLAVSLTGGCSFIFDFQECATTEDCVGFDDPEAKQFFVCTNANKCVLEVGRECRADGDCADNDGLPICGASGECVAD